MVIVNNNLLPCHFLLPGCGLGCGAGLSIDPGPRSSAVTGSAGHRCITRTLEGTEISAAESAPDEPRQARGEDGEDGEEERGERREGKFVGYERDRVGVEEVKLLYSHRNCVFIHTYIQYQTRQRGISGRN